MSRVTVDVSVTADPGAAQRKLDACIRESENLICYRNTPGRPDQVGFRLCRRGVWSHTLWYGKPEVAALGLDDLVARLVASLPVSDPAA